MVKRYLTLTSFEQALSILKESFPDPGHIEKNPIMQAIGRVVANPV